MYTAGHCWLDREEADLWRVGLTRFATRILGTVVEVDFETRPGSPIEIGQVVGWLEGLKAATDVYAVISGRFEGVNPDLAREIETIDADPYGRGWLYRVRGNPGDDCLDVHGYVSFLDATIDRILCRRHDAC